MKDRFLPLFADPLNHQPLELLVFERSGDRILAGLLHNQSSWYPIIGGIPRLLIGPLRHQLLERHHSFLQTWRTQMPETARKEWDVIVKNIGDLDRFDEHQAKTGASFAYEWKNIYRENDFEKQNFLHFIGPFITEKTIRGLTVVDVGCGSGRFTKQALNCGASVAFGVDVGDSVEVAYELTKEYDNACIVQADIYHLPFAPKFDLAYSIGVVHHLPDPPRGFAVLSTVVRPGGTVAIWVYNRRHNKRAIYLYEPMRSLLKRLPKPVVYKLSYAPAVLAHSLNGVTHYFHRWGAKGLAKKVPFSYYANFPFNMKLNDSFDVLATPKSNYYYVEQIQAWFRQANLQSIQWYEHPEAGITCQGVKPSSD